MHVFTAIITLMFLIKTAGSTTNGRDLNSVGEYHDIASGVAQRELSMISPRTRARSYNLDDDIEEENMNSIVEDRKLDKTFSHKLDALIRGEDDINGVLDEKNSIISDNIPLEDMASAVTEIYAHTSLPIIDDQLYEESYFEVQKQLLKTDNVTEDIYEKYTTDGDISSIALNNSQPPTDIFITPYPALDNEVFTTTQQSIDTSPLRKVMISIEELTRLAQSDEDLVGSDNSIEVGDLCAGESVVFVKLSIYYSCEK